MKPAVPRPQPFCPGRWFVPGAALLVAWSMDAGCRGNAGNDDPLAAPGWTTEKGEFGAAIGRDPHLIRVEGPADVGLSGLGAWDASQLPELDSLGIWADLDGDDRAELVATSRDRRHTNNWPSAEVWRVENGALVRVDRTLPRSVRALVDLDGDGHLDLIGDEQGLSVAWGSRGGAFGPLEKLPIRQPEGSNRDDLWSISGLAADDVDDDGWLDLVGGVGCCAGPCRDLHVLQQTAPRRFEDRWDWVENRDPINAWTVASLRVPGGRLLGAVGIKGCGGNFPGGDTFRHASGGEPEFRMAELVPAYGHLATLSPMGLAVDDLASDGGLHGALTLGLSQRVVRLGTDGLFAETQSFPMLGPSGRPLVPWATHFVDLDGDGTRDWLTANADDQAPESLAERRDLPFHGLTVAYGEGRGRFATPSLVSNLGHLGHHRTIDVADADGNGAPDFAVGSQTGGVEVLRGAPSGRMLSIRLRGSTSGTLASHARLTATLEDGSRQMHVATPAAQPFIFTSAVTFVGLARSSELRLLEVEWPTGVTQRFEHLVAGRRHTLEEPPAFRIAPVSRRLPADGRSRFEVTLMPRDPSGALTRDKAPTVHLTGEGALLGEPTWQDDGWHLFVVAPREPGQARIEISFGGLRLKVRPRLIWEAP